MWTDGNDPFFDEEEEEEKKIEQYEKCCYCREEKIHPAYKEHDLCSSCASDLFEDYHETIDKYDNSLKKKLTKPKKSKK